MQLVSARKVHVNCGHVEMKPFAHDEYLVTFTVTQANKPDMELTLTREEIAYIAGRAAYTSPKPEAPCTVLGISQAGLCPYCGVSRNDPCGRA